jgi:hypothetical protein
MESFNENIVLYFGCPPNPDHLRPRFRVNRGQTTFFSGAAGIRGLRMPITPQKRAILAVFARTAPVNILHAPAGRQNDA